MNIELTNMKILIKDLKNYTILDHRNSVDRIIEELFAYIDGTLNQEQKIVKKVRNLDFQTIFEALTCLTDSGYKLSKKEKSTITRLITIRKHLDNHEEK